MSETAEVSARKYERVRQFRRHRFDSRIQASVFREGMITTCWGRTSEIGRDGISATLSGELHVGEVASLEFYVPFPAQVMKLRAAVRYSRGLLCGFEFLILTDEQKMTLSEVCSILADTH